MNAVNREALTMDVQMKQRVFIYPSVDAFQRAVQRMTGPFLQGDTRLK
ncbi:rCG34758 [Rattus norvegicus]|uniref:RCG34758 n=1 Tax=Rattus norvegicus TaxID=10116 RepID=A6HJW3_RAT|nr:rCG34758 [Rattus norvegicus]